MTTSNTPYSDSSKTNIAETQHGIVALAEATMLSSQLQTQLEQLAEWHQRNAGSMSDEDAEASFSVMGKVGSLIEVIELLNAPDKTADEAVLLNEAMSDGKSISTQISQFLEGQA